MQGFGVYFKVKWIFNSQYLYMFINLTIILYRYIEAVIE